MNVTGSLHLAWRYIGHHRTRTALLAFALGLTLALPLAVRALMEIAQREFRARADSTPLVLGAKGSALELTLNALYFRRRGVETITVKPMERLRASGLAKTIPIHARHHAQEAPVIGTSLDYFPFRGLRIAEGRMITRLGDCVVGAGLARQRHLHPGGALSSSPEQVFDIAGVYPLKMRITGVLAESHSADDDAVFVDVKTAWLIEGIAHGHDDVVRTTDPNNVLERKDGNVAATPAVRMFTEVTDENLGSFHFHGDPLSFPLTAVIVLPDDAKARAILLGRYQNAPDDVQLVQPVEQMDALLASLFQAERLTILLVVTLGVAVLLIAALVFALSFKMRRREFATLEDIGVAGRTLALVKFLEVTLVGAAAAGIVLVVEQLARASGPALVRILLR
jgi:putative ABC transport system permease protein